MIRSGYDGRIMT